MKCAECCMWWADEPDIPCSCHADPNWPAPCEHEDDYDVWEEDDYDECGFDPYEGCYTYDC